MSKQITDTNQQENIHRRAQWITKYLEKQRKQLSPQNFKAFLDYNNDMIIHSISENTRYKNLNHFGLLTKILQKDWGVTSEWVEEPHFVQKLSPLVISEPHFVQNPLIICYQGELAFFSK